MNKFSKYISAQFKDPKGLGGVIITIIQNMVNRELYKTTVSLVEMNANDKLLDIGYGNGHLQNLCHYIYKYSLFLE